MIRRLLALACILPWLLVLAPPARASIPPHYRIGPVDLDAYCKSQGNQSAVLDGATAYDWHCVTPTGGRSSIFFDQACVQQYGANTVDRIDNFYDPASVSCWRVASTIPFPAAMLTYCRQVLGHNSLILTGSTAYNWHCADVTGGSTTLYDLSMPQVCAWTAGGYLAFDRFANFYDPQSWECLL